MGRERQTNLGLGDVLDHLRYMVRSASADKLGGMMTRRRRKKLSHVSDSCAG